jgi:dienelactone hydrolase
VSIKSEAVRYRDGQTSLTGYVAWDDESSDRRPGVLVVHGGAGLDDHAKGRAQRMAALGYVALACDMYGDGIAGDRQRIMATIAELRADRSRLLGRATAGLDQLAAHSLVNGRHGAVGYCFGGMTVLESVRQGMPLAGAVSVHGTLETSRPATPGSIRPKLLVCHGALDPHVPTMQVTAFADEMRDAGADWQLIVYGGAMHGFTHEHADPARMPGVAYHAPSDARSSVAIRQFFLEAFSDTAEGARS